MSRASQIPQSQYFDQAAQLSGQRPSRLQDIEGYDLMRQARDEALEASGQQFAGQGKFMSGSRLREAGDIGAQAAQQLVAQDDARRQQQVSNLMGLGAQDVSAQQRGFQNLLGAEGQQFGMGQQGFQNLQSREQADLQRQQANIANLRTGAQDYSSIRQQNLQNLMGVQGLEDARRQQQMQNLGTLAQQDLGVQQMNYSANQDLMNRQRELMGMGLGVDQSLGNLAVQQGQQLGQAGYSSAQDQANLLMGGQAQSAGLTQAGSGYNMAAAAGRGNILGDLIQTGASLYGGGAFGGSNPSGGINYGGNYRNDNYLMG